MGQEQQELQLTGRRLPSKYLGTPLEAAELSGPVRTSAAATPL